MQTTPKRKATTGTTKIGNLAYSVQSSNLDLSGGTPNGDVPGISTVLETTGRPVFLTVQNCTLLWTATAADDVSGNIRVFRNASLVYDRGVRLLADGSTAIQFNEYEAFSFYDRTAPAGTNTYTMTASLGTGAALSVRTIELYAKES